ncbi:fimbria/pilus outer membrane usher protein [Bdellovibrio sp. SKB1291214]|uniref:fimbria/pilus outer membrane usher protein n=1 Tax=Bdellovibrio sp. SKB1291214 TaxID=1732569 RepID=UPI000B515687|nr:fimbria/pilus outer membrane usher protein [Bdellovibrio sp. SKB1291214]UYL10380.1 fimbria/pilus outer membrane usher protein [Bdellovibrio sp. SKB1291214]
MRSLLAAVILFVSALASAAGVRPDLPKPYLMAPVILDSREMVQVWVFPRDSHKEFMVEAGPLLDALKRTLKDGNFKIVKSLVQPKGVLSLANLDAAGLKPVWNEANLELVLNIPLNYRKAKDLSVTYIEVDENRYYRPDAHSGYLNFRASQPYQHGESIAGGKLPLVGRFDLVENVQGFVLEAGTEYQEHADYSWNRQDTRIRTDDETNMIRYTLGDLSTYSRGFQAAPSLGGLSFSREFSIQPYRTLRPISRTEIEIKRPSLVEVYVNGLLTSQQRLGPGRFNVRDFPTAIGLSDVRIKVRDDLGQEETYDFSLLFENSVLNEGTQEFSYNFGSPWGQSQGDRNYSNEGIFSSLFHRWGVTDKITLGVNFQNYLDKTMPGIEYTQIAEWGLLSLDSAYGTANGLGGWGNRLTYRSLDRMYGYNVPFVAAAEVQVRDPEFQQPVAIDVLQANILRRYDLQLSTAFGLGGIWGVGGSYEAVPAGSPDRRFYRTNLSYPINISNRIEFSIVREVSDHQEDRGLISYFWSEPAGRYSVSAYHETLTKSTTATVNRNNFYNYDDVRASASIQRLNDSTNGTLYAEYLTQPASYRLDQFSTSTNGQSINTTTVGISTAFAWVGNRGAFSQPITDSFILIASDNFPKGSEMLINPMGTKGEAQLGPRSSAVLKDRTSYYRYMVNLDSTSLPTGYLLDKEYYGAMPTYKSGILIETTMNRKVMVKGRLIMNDQSPLALVAGDVVNEQGQLVDNTFFTNRNGQFVIEGLAPGKYKVMTDRPDLSGFEIMVTDDPSNSVNVGDIVVTKEAR